MTRCPSVGENNRLITVVESQGQLMFPLSFLSTGCRKVLHPILNVREDGWSQQIDATLYLKGGGGVYA